MFFKRSELGSEIQWLKFTKTLDGPLCCDKEKTFKCFQTVQKRKRGERDFEQLGLIINVETAYKKYVQCTKTAEPRQSGKLRYKTMC